MSRTGQVAGEPDAEGGAAAGAGRPGIAAFLCEAIATKIGAAATADRDADLFELGLDSIDAVEVTGEIELRYGIEVDPLILFECRTVNAVADRVAGLIPAR